MPIESQNTAVAVVFQAQSRAASSSYCDGLEFKLQRLRVETATACRSTRTGLVLSLHRRGAEFT